MLVPAALQAGMAPGTSPAVTGNGEIRSRLEGGADVVVAGIRLHTRLLRQFYAAHGDQPVWPTHQAQASALMNAVLRAGTQGLDPNLFHAALLRNPVGLSPIDRELLLSDAFLGYADALARGVLPIEDRMDDEDLTPGPVNAATALDSAINSPDPAAAIEALAPDLPSYTALRKALQYYQSAAAPEAMPPQAAAGAARGRRPAPAPPSNADRAREIMVNLERLRWLPRHLPADRVWVNIANAQLVLYRADLPIFRTRVVVGEVDKQTPEFRTTIDSLLFNPPWNVPSSIAGEEILPKLSRNPNYLSQHHMIRRSNGAIQQQAGPYSALGRLKFEMVDRFDVYLHDTPQKNLFRRDDRRQSHGCVRVENPRELAALLLQQPVEAINKAIALGYTHRRVLPDPIPVFLVYQTAFVDADGKVGFRPDVYGRDAEVWQRLHPAPQAPVAQDDPAGQRRG